MLKSFVKDLLAYLPSRLLPALTGLITAPILTRLFLPVEYGHWALASGVSELLVALACSGFGSAAIRFYPAYSAKSELGIFFATLGAPLGTVVVAVSLVSAAAVLLLRGHVSTVLYNLLPISILIFIFEAGFTTLMTVVRAQERSGVFTAFTLLFRYGSLVFGLLLVTVFGLGVEGLLWGTLLALVLTLPLLMTLTLRGTSIVTWRFRPPDALQIWRYAWPLALGNVAMWGLRLSDRYLISFFRPGSEVGLYSVAYNISGKSIDMLVALFLLSVSPMVMNTWQTEGRRATERALAMATRVYLILCLPVAAGLTVLAFPFVALLTAEPYHEGARIVGYVAFSSFAWGLSHIAQMGIVIKKKALRLGTNQVLAALVNLGLNLVLIPRYGFVAAGITTLIGYAVLVALQTRASQPHLTWRFPFKTLRNSALATTLMGVTAFGICALSGNRSDVHLGYLSLSIVAAVPSYVVCLWCLGEVNEAERIAVRRLWRRASNGATRAVRELGK